ncbi:MAG: adenosylhomocysteinase [Candidatus Micrarchaeota archaeon]|nr:adenosylhomocysteinase [Candidatus Micrarchaeota archaeon]MDE1848238.1 adenosylhomocysteinase [Candidatus Micrarchaeota archaeon]MDE1864908.1 adenosylhomocysteinase [Candidatus Micrarchaeota archaeon]
MSKVKDISLADQGRRKIEMAEMRMPVLMKMREIHSKKKSLEGISIAGCLHVTKETAVLVETLKACGAKVSWSGCNPLSTQDDIAAALAKNGIDIYAWKGVTQEEYYWCIDQTLKGKPQFTMDDGADLVFTLHKKRKEYLSSVIGGTEETATGVHRIKAMAQEGALKYPIIAVNDAETKSDFDNVFGTGQSALDGVIRATNILFAGKNVVIAGYGHCGRGLTSRAKGLGANVIVTEIDPICALRARMEGFAVMTMDEASKIGDIFITATGCKDVITQRHMQSMRNGAVLANAGHFNVEVNAADLKFISKSHREVRPENEEYTLRNGNRVYLIAQGRLVNLAAAEGHPSEVMDMSFANQMMAILRLSKEGKKMKPGVYEISRDQDQEVARLKLASMGIKIDSLSDEQLGYMNNWQEGT